VVETYKCSSLPKLRVCRRISAHPYSTVTHLGHRWFRLITLCPLFHKITTTRWGGGGGGAKSRGERLAAFQISCQIRFLYKLLHCSVCMVCL